MSRSDEYRQIAHECIEGARTSRSADQRKQLLELAKMWMTAASMLDHGTKGLRSTNMSPSRQHMSEVDKAAAPSGSALDGGTIRLRRPPTYIRPHAPPFASQPP